MKSPFVSVMDEQCDGLKRALESCEKMLDVTQFFDKTLKLDADSPVLSGLKQELQAAKELFLTVSFVNYPVLVPMVWEQISEIMARLFVLLGEKINEELAEKADLSEISTKDQSKDKDMKKRSQEAEIVFWE